MFIIILYIIMVLLLLVSLFKSKEKTYEVIKYSISSFMELLPKLVGLFLLITIILSYVNTDFISKVLGDSSGVLGIITACVMGSMTIMPTMIAYPLAAELLELGAGYSQVTVFITTLTMVGVLTLPMEIDQFGIKIAIRRNIIVILLAIISSVFIAIIMRGNII